MHQTVIKTGLLMFAITFIANINQVSALAPEQLLANKPSSTNSLQLVANKQEFDKEKPSKKEVAEEPTQPAVEKPKEYVVVKGDSLSVIAKAHQTTWVRIFDKNTQIQNPDIIKVGEVIIIPLASEQLQSRVLPVTPAPAVASTAQSQASTNRMSTPVAPRAAQPAPRPSYSTVSRGSSAGNTYTAGYCTWYVKNRRPDLPNNLGNADTWVARASAQGLPTGSAPQVGAVGQRGMHVVYVEAVNADGTVYISEMNRVGLYIQSTRTVPASYFQYIY